MKIKVILGNETLKIHTNSKGIFNLTIMEVDDVKKDHNPSNDCGKTKTTPNTLAKNIKSI